MKDAINFPTDYVRDRVPKSERREPTTSTLLGQLVYGLICAGFGLAVGLAW